MSGSTPMDAQLRAAIMSDPEAVLEDQAIMQALVAANEKSMGGNIVDLRGIAMERLEARLDRLEDTHRSVIAAAYENLAGTNQINRAVLRLLEARTFEDFLDALSGDVAHTLRIDAIRLMLESHEGGDDPALAKVEKILCVVPDGFVEETLSEGRSGPLRQVILRQRGDDGSPIFGAAGDMVRSEACLMLDLGAGRLPGLLVMGSEDPHMFTPQQGTDLLAFFAGVFERSMRHWLG